MTTALTLTPQPSTASVLLEITGAPAPGAVVYQYIPGVSHLGVDSWTSGNTDTASPYGNAGETFVDWAQATSGTATTAGYIKRTVTGFTIGQSYRFTMEGAAVAAGTKWRIGVTGVGESAYLTNIYPTMQVATYTFVATATSHEITFWAAPTAAQVTASAFADDPKVENIDTNWQPFSITRVDANGAHPVRLLDGQEPVGGVLTVTDYEPALTGTVRYDVADGLGTVTSVSTSLDGDVSLPVLHIPVLPQFRESLESVTGYDSNRENSSTRHDIVDRTDPVFRLGLLRMRAGTLSMWVSDYETGTAVESLLNRGEIVMLRQPDYPGMDMYFVAERARLSPGNLSGEGQRWTLDITYAEVAVPSGPLLGAVGWTFEEMATMASFLEVRTTFTDFADLAAG